MQLHIVFCWVVNIKHYCNSVIKISNRGNGKHALFNIYILEGEAVILGKVTRLQRNFAQL